MDPIRVTATSGRIEITAEARDDVVVDRGQQHPMGGVLEVKGESAGVVLRVPAGTDLIVGAHSGRVRLQGPVGDLRVTTRSGAVEVEACGDLDVRSVSGRLDIGVVSGSARIKAGSGRVTIEEVGGDLTVTSVSGRITVARAGGRVHATSVNGRVEVGMTDPCDARCESVSGRVDVTYPRETRPDASLRSISGRCDCDLDAGSDCRVWCRTVSGRITVRGRS